jgi:hypothetical protein
MEKTLHAELNPIKEKVFNKNMKTSTKMKDGSETKGKKHFAHPAINHRTNRQRNEGILTESI